VAVIWAHPGTIGSRIIEAMQSGSSANHPRTCKTLSREGTETSTSLSVLCTVQADGCRKSVELQISSKPPSDKGRVLKLEVGRHSRRSSFMPDKVNLANKLADSRLASMASQVLATYVVHQRGWRTEPRPRSQSANEQIFMRSGGRFRRQGW